MNIKVLDCTLRDGGYINNWNFSQFQVHKIIDSLEKSDIDIIELGYLDNKKGTGENSTRFNSVFSVDSVLSRASNNHTKVVMIDLFAFNVDELPKRSNTKIDGIRLAFHKKDIADALLVAETIIALGYKLFLQPMVTKNYDDNEFTALITKANALNVYALYVVDSFGSMTLGEFRKYINLADNNLDENVKLGYHSHNNMQLAFSNAIDLCTSNVDREVILDGKTTYWHKNGQIDFEENYKDGKEDGKWTTWHENGQIMIEANYIYGDLVSETRYHYFENGQIKSEKNYKDGVCISGDCD